MINDTFVHLANPHLPFGGCGESGFGSYHGKWGFEEFSHKRSVLARPLFLDIDPWINTKKHGEHQNGCKSWMFIRSNI